MPECIIFAIDADMEGCFEATKGITRLEVIKQSCIMIAAAKKRVNSQHVFAVALLKDTAELFLGATNNLDMVIQTISRVQPFNTSFQTLELGSLISLSRSVEEKLYSSLLPSQSNQYGVRVLSMYCRSCSVPVWRQCYGQPLAMDVLYMHERPIPGTNCPQEVFTALEEHCDAMSRAAGHQSYIFECNASNLKKWMNVVVWLLAHTRHRQPQSQLHLTPPDLSSALSASTRMSSEPGGPTSASSLSKSSSSQYLRQSLQGPLPSLQAQDSSRSPGSSSFQLGVVRPIPLSNSQSGLYGSGMLNM